MVFSLFSGFGKRKYKALIKEGNEWYLCDVTLKYDKQSKKWWLHLSGKLKGEKIPVTGNLFDYLHGNHLIIVRQGLDKYNLIKIEDKEKITEYPIKPEEIAEAYAQKERLIYARKGLLEKFLPIIFLVIAMIGFGIFLAIVNQTFTQKLELIANTILQSAEIYRNATLELANAIRQPLPPR